MRLFRPHFCVPDVFSITPVWLADAGLETLLLDVDCTLKRYRAKELSREILLWLGDVLEAGVRVCLVSNGVKHRIEPVAIKCGLPFIAMALKPLPFGCWRAIRQLGVRRQQTAMVGDQLFADILAGNLAGLTTILVEPIHPEEEPWFTRSKRPLERWVLGREAVGEKAEGRSED